MNLSRIRGLTRNPIGASPEILRAYLDASETMRVSAGARVLSVAGYVLSFENWKKLDRAWRRMLKDSGLDFFHMTDFESFKGPYKNWTPKQHEAVIKRVVGDINGTASYFVSFGIQLDHYDLLAREAKVLLGPPYRFGAAWCMGSIGRWLEDQGISESVAYVFELGDKDQYPLREGVARLLESRTFRETLRVHSLNFEEKKKTPALQAADVLSFESSKQMLRNIGAENRPIRKSLYALLEAGLPHESIQFDSAALDRWITEHRSPSVRLEVLKYRVKSELP